VLYEASRLQLGVTFRPNLVISLALLQVPFPWYFVCKDGDQHSTIKRYFYVRPQLRVSVPSGHDSVFIIWAKDADLRSHCAST